METTLLSTLLTRMNRWRDISTIEEQFKVRDLDQALRELRREFNLPWTLKRSTLRIFDEVKEYPVASDHDELAFLEKDNIENYANSARFFNTSIEQFYQEVQNSRNILAEIWDGGTKFIGADYSKVRVGSQRLSTAEVVSEYTASGDASDIELDNVNFKKGNGSIKFTVTNSTGVATIKNTITSYSDSNYKRKYQFRWIYLVAVPTSIEMRLQTNDSNYLKTVVNTQFSGQAFKANSWNQIAQDLNNATEVGTFNPNTIASEKTILNGAASGIYNLDDSNVRQWELLAYWYYSKFNVLTEAATSPDQEYFFNSSEEYETTSKLLGDSEWADVVMFDAMLTSINEKENPVTFELISKKREDAWDELFGRYPSMKPLIITKRHRFDNNPQYAYLHRRQNF